MMETLTNDTIDNRQRELVDEFAFLDDWMLRYQHIIEHGERLEPLSAGEKTDDRLVKGCQSQLWFVPEITNGTFHLKADSDSALVKGLASLIIRVVDDQPVETVANAEFAFLEDLELKEHLSPNRANGLHSMVTTIRMLAQEASA